MTNTIEIDTYTFAALDDSAKETARENYRTDYLVGWDWYDSVYEDFQNIGKILGIEFDKRDIGRGRTEPKIWFSGFSCQGDGACFEGSYSYAKGAAKAIREYAPKDETLHGIADTLQAIQRRHFYGLMAFISQDCRHYMHSHTMFASVEHDRDGWVSDDAEEAIQDVMRGLADWLYRSLEAEYEHLMSDEHIDEMLTVNEYVFDKDGSDRVFLNAA